MKVHVSGAARLTFKESPMTWDSPQELVFCGWLFLDSRSIAGFSPTSFRFHLLCKSQRLSFETTKHDGWKLQSNVFLVSGFLFTSSYVYVEY